MRVQRKAAGILHWRRSLVSAMHTTQLQSGPCLLSAVGCTFTRAAACMPDAVTQHGVARTPLTEKRMAARCRCTTVATPPCTDRCARAQPADILQARIASGAVLEGNSCVKVGGRRSYPCAVVVLDARCAYVSPPAPRRLCAFVSRMPRPVCHPQGRATRSHPPCRRHVPKSSPPLRRLDPLSPPRPRLPIPMQSGIDGQEVQRAGRVVTQFPVRGGVDLF